MASSIVDVKDLLLPPFDLDFLMDDIIFLNGWKSGRVRMKYWLVAGKTIRSLTKATTVALQLLICKKFDFVSIFSPRKLLLYKP